MKYSTIHVVEHVKPKSAAKIVFPRSEKLQSKVINTMDLIAEVVGGTLGPGGRPVLIERQDPGLPPFVTKDGVTVFRAIGFMDPIDHALMETARDAAIRTADEAGDGTTTATILSAALLKITANFCRNHTHITPQEVCRRLQKFYRQTIVPELDRAALPVNLHEPIPRRRGVEVATISANGDTALAETVVQCFDQTGDDGNVTIVEASGQWGYEAEKIDGYPVAIGYEASLQRFYPVFINRVSTQQAVLDNPIFILYHGRLNDIQRAAHILQTIQDLFEAKAINTPNVVLVATGFSEAILASLATAWSSPGSINVLPLLVPLSPLTNGQREFLDDLAALTGAEVRDPITSPIETLELEGIGNLYHDAESDTWKHGGVRGIEMGRYRTTILGHYDESLLLERAEKVKSQAEQCASELDRIMTRERLAKLTSGISRLKVIGSSNADTKERRDRAEDAVCALRGAIRHGALPGGCWALLRLAELAAKSEDLVVRDILPSAFRTPFVVLLDNAGLAPSEISEITKKAFGDAQSVYNVVTREFEPLESTKVYDSLPAVRDAIKNSLSVATVLGTVGGVIVFPRDTKVDFDESRAARDFQRYVVQGEKEERQSDSIDAIEGD